MKEKKKTILAILVIAILGFLIIGLRLINSNKLSSDEELLKSHYNGIECRVLSGETARPGSDIIEPRRDICAEERAWFENEPDFCSLHSNPDNCFTWMAIKLKDPSLCSKKGVKTEGCLRLVELTKNEDTWHWDYIRKNMNPI